MKGGKQNLYVDKNSDYEALFSFFNDDNTAMDLSNYEPVFIVRETNNPASLMMLEITPRLIQSNKIAVNISAMASKNISKSYGYYNLILKSTSKKHRVLEGKISFSETVDAN